jgi:hypothetical protein
MTSFKKLLFDIIQDEGGQSIVAVDNLTYYLRAKWLSKMNNKFVIEYYVDELDPLKEYKELKSEFVTNEILTHII